MDTVPGYNCIVWTVRLSVALYAASVWKSVNRRNGAFGADRVRAWLWSSSWLMCVVHVLCAFHFQHHWDHDAALLHTAEMTERVVGLHWSGGLYINYLFLVMWGCDCISQLIGIRTHSPVTMQAVAAFMMFNATAIFGPGWWWAVVVLFSGCLWFRRRSARSFIGDDAA
ncbi:MAG: hypothetical protein R3C49_01155 [Planctomycetaceae bacterium]